MKLFVNLENNQLQESAGVNTPMRLIEAKRGDAGALDVQFVRSTVAQALAPGTENNMVFAVKQKEQYTSEALVLLSQFTFDSNTYTGSPNFNTLELTTLLGDNAYLDLIGEISWSEDGGENWSSTKTIPVRVHNDVVRGGEGSPEYASPSFTESALAVGRGTATQGQKETFGEQSGGLVLDEEGNLDFAIVFDPENEDNDPQGADGELTRTNGFVRMGDGLTSHGNLLDGWKLDRWRFDSSTQGFSGQVMATGNEFTLPSTVVQGIYDDPNGSWQRCLDLDFEINSFFDLSWIELNTGLSPELGGCFYGQETFQESGGKKIFSTTEVVSATGTTITLQNGAGDVVWWDSGLNRWRLQRYASFVVSHEWYSEDDVSIPNEVTTWIASTGSPTGTPDFEMPANFYDKFLSVEGETAGSLNIAVQMAADHEEFDAITALVQEVPASGRVSGRLSLSLSITGNPGEIGGQVLKGVSLIECVPATSYGFDEREKGMKEVQKISPQSLIQTPSPLPAMPGGVKFRFVVILPVLGGSYTFADLGTTALFGFVDVRTKWNFVENYHWIS